MFRNRLLKIAFNMGIHLAVLKRYFAGPLQQVVREALLLRVVGSGHSSTSLSAAPGETMMFFGLDAILFHNMLAHSQTLISLCIYSWYGPSV